jgi:excisionase family DNA binding protein
VSSTPRDPLPALAGRPKVLKTRDLAQVLDLCPDNVSDMARKGIIHGYKKGNQWRFRRKDVEAWMRARGAAPEGPS